MRYIPHETFRLCRFGHFPRHPHCAERSFDRHQDREWDVQRPIHGIMMRFLLSRILDKRLCDQVRISSVRPVVGCGVMPCIAYHIQQYYITQSHRSTWYGDPWHSLRHLAQPISIGYPVSGDDPYLFLMPIWHGSPNVSMVLVSSHDSTCWETLFFSQ